MRDLRQRSYEMELMDEQGVTFAEFHDCLVGLERINHHTLAYRPTLQWLRAWFENYQPIVLLDVASGGGDMLRQIVKKWPTRNAATTLVGVDLNPWAKKSAESLPYSANSSTAASLSARYQISYATANIFDYEPEQPVDIIISSLFTHHLTDAQIIDFLRWMDCRARKGWFINDLHRHPIPYYFIKWATALFSRNRLICHDAAVSVARSFTRADWYNLIEQAGLAGRVQVRWFFPFRLCVSCVKEAPG